jgi:hypothetical protein
MKSKIFLFVVYVGVIWLVGIFIFGKSGIGTWKRFDINWS